MELIFMRHGKAEDHALRPSDFERELTEEGRSRTLTVAAGLQQCLGEQKPRIWCSPLVRTRQTAEIVAGVLGGLEIELNEDIPDGHLHRLARGWSALNEDESLLIVGHEPHLSRWIAHLSGVVLPMKPACVAGLIVHPDKPTQGKLRWFAHPDVLGRVGTSTQMA
ncbi:phosphohistidine phosphatase SixA [Thermithiobacillus plumbiphilus]|uniref:Phosphohistidine phosphatase SixA n=1 Tax=Thermithiobacillus plumbiphilus TaxID=1729899 RepID=A0ABU9D4X1_9PROT